MKFNDLKKKTPEDLRRELDTSVVELMRYNAMVATGGIGKDAGKIKEIKRTIARIKTLQTTIAHASPSKPKAKPAAKKN